jgi:hypothetical protein
MENDNITVPPLRLKWYGDEIDGPPPTLKIRYEGVFNQYICYPYSEAIITLTNDTAFTIEPNQYKKLQFKILVITNVPAVSILYQSSLIFRLGISCVVTQIPTNDIPLHITIFNHCDSTKDIPKDILQFYCHTVLAKI